MCKMGILKEETPRPNMAYALSILPLGKLKSLCKIEDMVKELFDVMIMPGILKPLLNWNPK